MPGPRGESGFLTFRRLGVRHGQPCASSSAPPATRLGTSGSDNQRSTRRRFGVVLILSFRKMSPRRSGSRPPVRQIDRLRTDGRRGPEVRQAGPLSAHPPQRPRTVHRPHRTSAPLTSTNRGGPGHKSGAASRMEEHMSPHKPNMESSIHLGNDRWWHGRVTMGVKDDGSPDRRHRRARTEPEVVRRVGALEALRDKGRAPAGARRHRFEPCSPNCLTHKGCTRGYLKPRPWRATPGRSATWCSHGRPCDRRAG